MFSFFGNIVITSLFSSIFLMLGSLALFSFFKNKSLQENGFLKISSSFFIGLGIFLSGWQILGRFLGLRLALGFMLALSLLVIFKFRKLVIGNFVNLSRQFKIVSALVLLIVIIGLVKSLAPMPEYFLSNPEKVSPFAGFGVVVHSFRASNIALYIFQNNNLPILNQNIGQSFLASLPMFFGFISPQLSLVLWLNIILSFAISFSYGLISLFVKEKKWKIISELFMVFGSAAFALAYISITDVGSTLFLSSNCDSLISVFNFTIFLFICFDFLNRSVVFKNCWLFFVWFGFSGNMFGAQNIILALLLLGYLLITNWKSEFLRCQILAVSVAFIVGAFLGAGFGGMLSPQPILSKVNIPGIMTVQRSKRPPLALRVPQLSQDFSDSLAGTALVLIGTYKNFYLDSDALKLSTGSATIHNDYLKNRKKNNYFISILVELFRLVEEIFYPLAGLILFYILRKQDGELNKNEILVYLFKVTCRLFVLGVVVSSCFIFYGYSWELTRFLYVGNYLAMFFAAFVFSLLLKKFFLLSKAINRIKEFAIFVLLVLLYAVSLFGPLSQYFIVGVAGNFVLGYDWSGDMGIAEKNGRTLSTPERFGALINCNKITSLN